MDHELLVASRVQDGRAFISALVRERIADVAVALWVKPTGVGYWSFYIGSRQLASMKKGDAFYILHSMIYRLDDSSLLLSEFKLVQPTDPIARDAIAFRDQLPPEVATSLRGCKLGELAIDEAYIYPQIVGTMSRQDVVQRVAALLSREATSGPTSITLKNGNSIQAVPTGIRRDVPGGVRIVLHDMVSDTDLTVSVDDVFAIN
jgi:hypothetical protein